MLTEQFVAAIAAPSRPNTGVTRDVGIFVHEFQPMAAQRAAFKKSAAPRNCIAVSATHIFAAQADKAVVHVYSREKGNQELLVPFQERIHSLALAAEDSVLLLGTEGGRILVWEICTSRLVSTPPSHLQRVTSLAVDPTSNFFLSGSPDSQIHVWSLPALLSFAPDTSRAPLHTLSIHRGPVTALAVGHSTSSANIAVSASSDNSAIVWNYQTGTLLRTYLLEATPQALVLDPADRAVHAAYADGSIQTIDFFAGDAVASASATNILHDPTHAHRPLQPPPRTRFNATSQNLGPALSISLNWDGTALISGHESGKIASWDVAKGAYSSTLGNLPGAVTNLSFLEPTGWPETKETKFKIPAVVKPRPEAGNGDRAVGVVPALYTMNVQLTGRLNTSTISATTAERGVAGLSLFEKALTHSSFPDELMDEGLAELAAWDGGSQHTSSKSVDFLPLAPPGEEAAHTANEQLEELKVRFKKLQEIQKVTFGQITQLKQERRSWVDLEAKREARKARRRARLFAKPKGHAAAGTDGSDQEEESSDDDEVMADSEEITDDEEGDTKEKVVRGGKDEVMEEGEESHSSEDGLGDLERSSADEEESDGDDG
ncbi:WD40 repeat-like protein [Lophium mytilinum]|uniref:Pre-rRNA-processing protein IPI3 n=1 Tax=Lophium mytilinum TaxID=390894 RepID=A0A6A6RFM9_9PEZI|nr:WD40 repeat-like protein [Lophium mytilinum]